MAGNVPLKFRERFIFLLLTTVVAFALGWVAAYAVPEKVLSGSKSAVTIPLAREVKTELKSEPVSGEGVAVRAEKQNDNQALLLGEVSAGSERSTSDEYIDIRNPSETPVSLDGWSIKKVDGKGRESTLVAPSRFQGVVVPPGGVIRVANTNAELRAEVRWPASYGLAYKMNGVILYRPSGTVADAVRWEELSAR